MRISIVSVGRFGAGHGEERRLFERYAGRLPFPLELREVEERKRLPPEKLKRREADLLLAAVPKGARVVALDETGKALSTFEFSGLLDRWRVEGTDIALLIGGADGLDDTVRSAADLLLSLGPMTWPHLLVRALVAEQIYRAHCVLSGHPYHRGR